MTDSELLQASIARENLMVREHALAKEAAMQQILQNNQQQQQQMMDTSESSDLLEFKSKLNSLKMITDPIMRQLYQN